MTGVQTCALPIFDAAGRGDLAAVRSLIEEEGEDVDEKDWVCDVISFIHSRCVSWL